MSSETPDPPPRPPDGPSGEARTSEPLITPEQVSRIRSLIEILQAEVPPPFRQELFRQLLPAALSGAQRAVAQPAAIPASPAPGAAVGVPTPPVTVGIGASRLNLARYAALLAAPGRTLVKALVTLDAAGNQLGIDWMSPSEIERFLVERAGVRSVYRTNISNALRGARQLVDRRRRGRGYEYRITLPGKEALEREVTILGSG